jgi:hypothetical protein
MEKEKEQQVKENENDHQVKEKENEQQVNHKKNHKKNHMEKNHKKNHKQKNQKKVKFLTLNYKKYKTLPSQSPTCSLDTSDVLVDSLSSLLRPPGSQKRSSRRKKLDNVLLAVSFSPQDGRSGGQTRVPLNKGAPPAGRALTFGQLHGLDDVRGMRHRTDALEHG